MANQSTRFATCLTWLLGWEGSVYTNDPDDAGGATRYGVIQTEYDDWRKEHGSPVRSVRYIEQAEYTAIFHDEYWDAIGADNLRAPYDLALFNVAVNSGVPTAKQFRQEVEAAHPGADALTLARAVCDRYEQFYHAIVARKPSQLKFLGGWLNRLTDCRKEINETTPLPTGATWEVYLSGTQLYDARQNEGDGRAWVALRTFLQAFFPAKEVTAKLALNGGDAYWDGKKMPVDEQQWTKPGGGSETWVPIRQVATWLGLDLDVDGVKQTITLTRPSGAAKATA